MTRLAVVVSAVLLLAAASVSAQMHELGRWNRGRLDREDRALRFERRQQLRDELRQLREDRRQAMRDRMQERRERLSEEHRYRHGFAN